MIFNLVFKISSKTDEFSINSSTKNNAKKNGTCFFKPNYGNKNIYSQMGSKLNEYLLEQERKRELEESSKKQESFAQTESVKQTHLVKEKADSSIYEDQNSDLKSSRIENVPFGKLSSINKWSAESKELQMSSGNASLRESMKRNVFKNRTTLKEELVISEQFQTKVPDYFTRKNFDLMRIVEDQVKLDKFLLKIFYKQKLIKTILLFSTVKKKNKNLKKT